MARIAFIQHFWLKQLGIMYISAVLKQHGHETLVAVGKPSSLARRVRAFRPDLLALHCNTGMQWWVSRSIRQLRQALGRRVPSLVGGPHPTFFPEMVEDPEIDIVCLGEGEHAVLDLAQALDEGNPWGDIPGLWAKRNGSVARTARRPLISNLDELPFPDSSLYDDIPFIRNAPGSPFITTRGCPYRCAFCFNHALRKLSPPGTPYVRRRSVANVLEELKSLKRRRRPQTLTVRDDHFCFFPHEWIAEFLGRYQEEIAIPFFILARADSLTPAVVKQLKASGCYCVELGVETGDEELRNGLLHKDLSDAQVREAAQLLHRFDLPFVTTNMIGLPGETMGQAWRTLALNIELRPTAAWCAIYQPYPGTELGEYCFERGLVTQPEAAASTLLSHSSSVLRQQGIKRLVNLHKFLLITVRFPRLRPLIRLLVRLPPNALYRWFYLASYLLLYHRRSLRLTRRRVVAEAWVALRHYL
jgi:radical SAM superfamily enzyme YgiQ (UPF0313 family)